MKNQETVRALKVNIGRPRASIMSNYKRDLTSIDFDLLRGRSSTLNTEEFHLAHFQLSSVYFYCLKTHSGRLTFTFVPLKQHSLEYRTRVHDLTARPQPCCRTTLENFNSTVLFNVFIITSSTATSKNFNQFTFKIIF